MFLDRFLKIKSFLSCCLTVLVTIYVGSAQAGPAHQPDAFETITVAKIILRPKGEYDFTVVPESFRMGLIKLLREQGLNALGGENAVFDKDKSAKARFWIGGTIEEISCAQNLYSSVKPCEITVMWELLDTRVDAVRYKVRTRYFDDFDLNNVEKDFPNMIGGTMRSLIGREKFLAIIRKGAELDGDLTYEPVSVKRCVGKVALPKGMNKVLDATVLIKDDQGTGSGFFISPDGFILTANHVVADSNLVTVKTHANAEMQAVVVRRNIPQDVALLKVSTGSPACLPLEYNAGVGTEIYGVGAPAGEELAFSVSKGIVSGMREFEGNRYVQTDTSLNPGNSGGPLVDFDGKAIALVSWKLAVPGFEGIAFGVPIGHALESIGVSTGARTTMADSEITQAQNVSSEARVKVVEDTEDPTKWDDILKQVAEAKQKEAERQARLRAQTAELDKKAWEDKQERRNARRTRAKSTMKKLWFFTSVMMTVGGAAMVGGTYGKFKSSEPTLNEYDTMTRVNTAGWVIGGIGVGTIALFYITGNRLRENNTDERATVQRQKSPQSSLMTSPMTLSVSANGFSLVGSF